MHRQLISLNTFNINHLYVPLQKLSVMPIKLWNKPLAFYQWHKTYQLWLWSFLPRPQSPTFSSHRQEATTKPHSTRFYRTGGGPSPLIWNTYIFTYSSPLVSALLPATAPCRQPARGLSNAVNINLWAIHKNRPDGGCDGASQGAFVLSCHVYSCGKSNINLFATVLSFLVITQSRSWFLKTALVLDIWVYESIKEKILHMISSSSLLGVAFLNQSYFCREREDQVLDMSTNIYWLYPIQPIFTSRGHA